MFNVKIEGLGNVLKRIEQYDKKLSIGVDDILSNAANNIVNNAKTLAPKGKSGALAASIGSDTGTKFIKSVFVLAPYAAYVEFGTGSKVFKSDFQFTPEMKAYAMEFYVSGKGRLLPSPYLFPSYSAEIIKIRNEIKKLFFSR